MAAGMRSMKFGEYILNGEMKPLIQKCYSCNNSLHSKRALYIRNGVAIEIAFVFIFMYTHGIENYTFILEHLPILFFAILFGILASIILGIFLAYYMEYNAAWHAHYSVLVK